MEKLCGEKMVSQVNGFLLLDVIGQKWQGQVQLAR